MKCLFLAQMGTPSLRFWPYGYSCAIGVGWPEHRSSKSSLIWQMKKGRLKGDATDTSARPLNGRWQSVLSRGLARYVTAPKQGTQPWTANNLYPGPPAAVGAPTCCHTVKHAKKLWLIRVHIAVSHSMFVICKLVLFPSAAAWKYPQVPQFLCK